MRIIICSKPGCQTTAGCQCRASLPPSPRALVLDAARYRWLRSRDLETVYDGGVFVGKTPDNVVLNFEDCDRAVDAAMMAEKDTGE